MSRISTLRHKMMPNSTKGTKTSKRTCTKKNSLFDLLKKIRSQKILQKTRNVFRIALNNFLVRLKIKLAFYKLHYV